MQKRNSTLRKALSILMTLMMILSTLSVLPASFTVIAADTSDRTIVIASSDYQYCNSSNDNGGSGGSYAYSGITAYGNDGSKQVVQNILNVMKTTNGITSADGFLFCGDYDYDLTYSVSNTQAGVNSLKEAISGVITPTSDNTVLVQGNHDSAIGTAGMSPSGNNDPSTGKYGVFVINEDDYPWNGGTEGVVKQTAQNLRDYLNSKIAAGFNAPIFVVSHLPLHFSMRSQRDGDNKYANYIFDVLNDGGDKGLNIIYLFGHNHSHGWDDYLGGSKIFLTRGDKINIAQSSKTDYNEETLNFSYVNAGYVGYYQNTNSNAPSTDLTMTSFEISGSDVVINRYSFLEQNVTSLKIPGRLNTESGYGTNEGSQTALNTGTRFTANTSSYASPYTLTLESVTDRSYVIPAVIEEVSPTPGGSDQAGKIYEKVNSADAIISGEKYLLICGDEFMVPVDSGYTDRIGFDVISTGDLVLGDTISGDFSDYEWKMELTGGKWVIGNGDDTAVLTRNASSSSSYDAVLSSSDSSPFTLSGSGDSFNFTTTVGSTNVVLNRNGSRELINGYTNNAANFSIYHVTNAAVGAKKYTKVTSVNDIISGKKYLLINNSNNFMTSQLSSDADVGFVLESTNGLTLADVITGSFDNYEWQLDSSNGKWTLKSGAKYAKLTSKSNGWSDASLVSSGATEFTIGGSGERFTFSSDSAVLNNHGTYHTIGGWADGATPFAIYRLDGEVSDISTDGFSSYVVYNAPSSGQVLKEGSYIFFGPGQNTVLTSAVTSDNVGLVGSTSYTISGSQISSAAACDVQVTVADAANNTYYFKIGDQYLKISGNSLVYSSAPTALKAEAASGNSGKVVISDPERPNVHIDTYNNAKWAAYPNDNPNNNEQITLYKRFGAPDNGTWVPVHETTTTAPVVTTYSLPSNGVYALAGSAGTLENSGTTGTRLNTASTGKPSGEHTFWNFTQVSGNQFRVSTVINGATYYLTSNGSLSTSQQSVALTVNADSTVTLPGVSGTFRLYGASSTTTPGTTTHTYTLDTDGINSGERYLIVAPSNNNYALTLNGANTQRTPVTISGSTITMNSDAYDWVLSGASGGYIKWDAGNYYLKTNNNSIGTATSQPSTNFSFSNQQNGNYILSFVNGRNTYYLRYASNNFSYNIAQNDVRLYRYTPVTTPGTTTYTYGNAWQTTATTTGGETTTVTDRWAMLEPAKAVSVGRGTDEAALADILKSSEEFKAYLGTSAQGDNAALTTNVTFDTSEYNPSALGTYRVPVMYNNTPFGYMTVEVVAEKKIASIELNHKEGTVYVGASRNGNTGAKLMVTYEDGTTAEIPVTVGMLIDRTGNFNCANLYCQKKGDYTGLGVFYRDNWFTDFTLHVIERDDYPEYPNPGSVRVGKSGNSSTLKSTGTVDIELTATGVPMNPGIDIVIVLDTSSSMKASVGTYNGQNVFFSQNNSHWYYESGEDTGLTGETNGSITVTGTRVSVMQDSLRNLLDSLGQVGDDGQVRDIEVAICDFNGYTFINNSTSTIYIGDSSSGISTSSNLAEVYTGSNELNADAFVNIQQLRDFNVRDIVAKSGTNYDYAFQQAYELLSSKQIRNDLEERDSYVIFMSDGSPFQYNYVGSHSSKEGWNEYLTGIYNSAEAVPFGGTTEYRYFYPGAGNKHRIAEAIKGDIEALFTIIDRDMPQGTVDVTGDGVPDPYMTEVPGLGAKMYSIGFCLAVDANVTVDTMETVIRNLATSDDYYYIANSAESLGDAFDSINNDIKVAATEAYFTDTMGEFFDIQLATDYVRNGNTFHLDPAPQIVVKEHKVYTYADYQANKCEFDEIGIRTGSSVTKETVTFNTDGTEGYSNLDSTHTNIISNDLITAHTFIYNLNKTQSKMIDTDGDGVNDYTLAPETFYWKIGIIADTEFSLNYKVYLVGSMEGERPEGTYETNESAVLYYNNYLGNFCHKDTVTPIVPWGAASTTYEFYLVNAEGQPVNRQGERVSFANRVIIGSPVTEAVYLNSDSTATARIVAQDKIPEYYSLYNPDAAYNILISSVTDENKLTLEDDTYIVGSAENVTTSFYEGSNPRYNKNGVVPDSAITDIYNTHVAFAVLLTTILIPDTAVIDYGLPVEIHPFTNDYNTTAATVINGFAAGVREGTLLYSKANGESMLDKNAEFSFGEVSSNGAVLRYTPSNMEMSREEVIYIEVKVGSQYYYSTVTVIPAANIYYEESFMKFSDNWSDATDKTAIDALQSEDRPGMANHSYGYDNAYADDTAYSLGTAKYALVSDTKDLSHTAEFTFCGTGFDIFSVTGGNTGTMLVDIYRSNGTVYKQHVVNTYYGYSYGQIFAVSAPDGTPVPTLDSEADGAVPMFRLIKEASNTSNGVTTTAKFEQMTKTPMYYDEAQNVTETPYYLDENGVVTTEETDTPNYAYAFGWVENSPEGKALYQVPVIRIRDLDYDTYRIVITPRYSPMFDKTKDDEPGYRAYVDGVRIYDPAGEFPEGAVADAYLSDKEYAPTYIEVRDHLIKAEDFLAGMENGSGTVDGSSYTNGALYIDGLDALSSGTGNISDYIKTYTGAGPNNEVYLKAGQAIAFKLALDEVPDSVSIGMKLISKAPGSKNANICILNADSNGVAYRYALSSTDEMYYDIRNAVEIRNGGETAPIVVVNASQNDAILSLTSLKIATGTAPAAPMAMSMMVSDVSTLRMAVRALNTYFHEAEVDTSAVTLDWVSTDLEVGAEAVLKITAPQSTAAVIVDGKEITDYVLDENMNKVFTFSFTVTKTGTDSVNVVIRDGEGYESVVLLSEEITVTEPVSDNNEPTTDNNEPTTDNNEPTTDNNEPTTDNNEPTTDNNEPTTDNNEPTTDNNEPTTDNGSDGGEETKSFIAKLLDKILDFFRMLFSRFSK